MPKRKQSRAKKVSFGNSVGLLSSLLGIFAFLTGISSLPQILSGSSRDPFADQLGISQFIPSSALYWLFFLSFLIVFLPYFYIILVTYRWLASHGFVTRRMYNSYYHANFLASNKAGDYVSMILFEIVGIIIWFLLTYIFFGSFEDAMFHDNAFFLIGFFGPIIVIGLIYAICTAANNAAWK